MKTYTITKKEHLKMLEITHDNAPTNPRKYTTIGYFITLNSELKSPDKNLELETIIEEASDYETSYKEQMKLIKKEYEKMTKEKVLKIYPVSIYKNGEIAYKLGHFNDFDTELIGYYVVTQKRADEAGAKPKDFEEIIEQEIEKYNSYINKKVYKYTLRNEKGEIIDEGRNFYEIEDIKKHLPKEWEKENLNEYFTHS